jgi:hypothetical protein
MEYLLLTYHHEGEPDERAESEAHRIAEACRENNLILRENGTLLLAATLQPTPSHATVSIHNGTVSVSDTEVPLTGVYLIHAKDMNDAIRTATHMPQARLGPIEIRAVVSVDIS